MRKGFTVLELLVASLLLGMLVTILTMIFNQSSIAWRTGVAGVADLDDVRDNMAHIRELADNAYIWEGRVYRVAGLWRRAGELRDRAIIAEGEPNEDGGTEQPAPAEFASITSLSDIRTIGVGTGDAGGTLNTYTVNVMSAGPDHEFDTWDDIWSFPDDFD